MVLHRSTTGENLKIFERDKVTQPCPRIPEPLLRASYAPSLNKLHCMLALASPADTDRCGPSYGNRVCGLGKCCGRDGRCGTTNETCWTGCQPLYGRCEPGRPIEEAPLYTFPQPIVLGTATAEVEQYAQTGYTTGSLFCRDMFEGACASGCSAVAVNVLGGVQLQWM